MLINYHRYPPLSIPYWDICVLKWDMLKTVSPYDKKGGWWKHEAAILGKNTSIRYIYPN